MYHATVIEIRRGTAHGKGSVAAVRPAPVAAPLPAIVAEHEEPAVHAGHDVLDDGPGGVRGADRPPVVAGRLRPVGASGTGGQALCEVADEGGVEQGQEGLLVA